jgi:hypothetical protein
MDKIKVTKMAMIMEVI